MNRGPAINWNAFWQADGDGLLLDLLANLPRERWAERNKVGVTLLHYACRGPNVAAVVALVQSDLVDVNASDEIGWTPVHVAVARGESRVLEVLCAAGADLRAQRISVVDLALNWGKVDCARVLVANGMRLSTVGAEFRHRIKPELKAFERGVLRCRAAVVAMLRVKKAAQLYHVDKFLMRELAYAMWATRTDERWQHK